MYVLVLQVNISTRENISSVSNILEDILEKSYTLIFDINFSGYINISRV